MDLNRNSIHCVRDCFLKNYTPDSTQMFLCLKTKQRETTKSSHSNMDSYTDDGDNEVTSFSQDKGDDWFGIYILSKLINYSTFYSRLKDQLNGHISFFKAFLSFPNIQDIWKSRLFLFIKWMYVVYLFVKSIFFFFSIIYL